MAKRPALSFCTSCFNRTYQLRQVFDANLESMKAAGPEVEWVIWDHGSTDGLEEYMLEQLGRCPETIHYIRGHEPRPWHMSVGKNMPHRLASGEVLMNLDCDNMIGDAVEVIRSYFTQGCRMLHMWSGIARDGTCGRIAVTSELFHRIKGYDETFFPMGFQDLDFIARAAAVGTAVLRHCCSPDVSVKNTREESVKYCSVNGMSWSDYERANRARSAQNLTAGRFVAANNWTPLSVVRRTGILQPTSPANA